MSAAAAPSTRRALTLAIGLYLVWVLATYLLEGRIHTLLRPEAMGARLSYALVANVLIGIGGSALVIRFVSRAGTVSTQQAGFRGGRPRGHRRRGRRGDRLRFLRLAGRSVLEPGSPYQRLRPGLGGLHSGDPGLLGRDRERISGFVARSRQMGLLDPGGDHCEHPVRVLPLRPQPPVQHGTRGRVPERDRACDEPVLLRLKGRLRDHRLPQLPRDPRRDASA